MPLAWAHAEYIKLVRSAADGQVFDLFPEVAGRYRNPRQAAAMEIWKFNRQVHTDSASVGTGHEFVDIRVEPAQRAAVRFTFFWTSMGRWEGRDFQVGIDEDGRGGSSSTREQKPLPDDLPHRRGGA